jgi:hypothetical protein
LPTTPLIYPPTSGQGSAGGRRVRGAASKPRLIRPSDRGRKPPQEPDPRGGALRRACQALAMPWLAPGIALPPLGPPRPGPANGTESGQFAAGCR